MPLFLEPLGSASPRPPGMLAFGGEPPREARLLLGGKRGGGRYGIGRSFGAGFSLKDQIPLVQPRLGPIYQRLIHSKALRHPHREGVCEGSGTR